MFSLKSWIRRWKTAGPRRPIRNARRPDGAAKLGVAGLEDRVVPAVYLSEDFSDNSAGWTLGTEWQIGSATLSTGQSFGNGDPAEDHTPTADDGVAGVRIGGNAATTVHDYYYLTSPAVNTSTAAAPLSLEFYRWLNSDYTPYMANRVEVYNGSSWATLWQTAGSPGIQDNSWVRQQFDLTPYKNAQMRVRFGFNVGSSGALTVSSWNLDDVTISSADPAPTGNGLAVQIVGAPANSPEGTAITLQSTVTDTNGGTGPYTYAWAVTKNGVVYPTGTAATGATFTFTPDDNGTYVVSLTVTSADGRTSTATTAAPTTDVLIIYDVLNTHTQALKNKLEAAGFNVALSTTSETLYNGTNPSLTPYEAVIHLDGTTWSSAMPTAGQQALVSYVQAGGAYLGSEWIAYEVRYGSMGAMRDLVLFDYQSERFTNTVLTLTEVAAQAGHPLLANVPPSVSFTAGALAGPAHTFATNPVTVLMTDQFGNPAVAVREFGSGRVVGFHNSGNYGSATALSDAELQQLYIDGIRWAARAGSGGGGTGGGTGSSSATITVTNAAPTGTLTNSGPVAEGSPVTVNFAGVSDAPGDLATLRYSFATSSAGLAAGHAAAGTTNSAQFTFTENGTYTVYGRVFDKDGGFADRQTSVVVTNAAPAARILNAPANTPEGTAVTLTSSVTDPGTADTFTYAWSVTRNGAAYPTGTVATGATFTFTPDDNGTYVVSLTVTDDDGGAGVATSPGGPLDVLIIYDTLTTYTQSLRSALQAAGFNVALSTTSETLYNGTNPSLAPYEAVIHLDGTTSATPMPAAGQQALTSYVQAGGAYLGSEWIAYEAASHPHMRDLILFTYGGFAYGSTTYADAAGQAAHPILASVPSSFTFNAGRSYTTPYAFNTNPVTVLMRDQGGYAAVAVREFGSGRVVGFNHAGNDGGYGTLADPNVQKLYVDGVKWAARAGTGAGAPGATITVTNVAPTLSDVAVTPAVNEGGTATVSGRLTDPGADTHTVTVAWGDGTTSVATLNPDGTFTASRTFADDIPTGTASDTYRVGVTARDDDGGTGGVGAQELVTNGGFETGSLGGWTVTVTGSGQWVANNGAADPIGPGTPTAPISGQFDALAQESGASTMVLSAPIVVPANVTSAVLSWADRIRNFAGSYSDPSQEWRVRVVGPTGAVIGEVFSTKPGDVLQQVGPNRRTFDLTSFFQGLAGQTPVRLSFELQNSFGFFNVNLDDVSLVVSSGPGLTVTVHNVAPTLADVVATPAVEGSPVTLTGRVVDPGTADTHTMVVAWGDGTSSAVALNPDRTFTATHVYRDDRPGGYQVGIAVRDDDGGTGGVGAVDLVVNGGFESGFTGWTVTTQNGSWTLNDGTPDPIGPGLPTAPISGRYDALAQQRRPSLVILSEPINVPSGITSAVLSWSDRIRNHAGTFSDPNQEWRVRVLDAAGTVLATAFSTNPGDPLQQAGPNLRSADLTSVLQARAGQTVRLSFELEDNLFYFNVNLDDVSLVVTTGAGVPVTVTNAAPSAPALQVSPAVGEGGWVTLSGTFTDAGEDDTHTVTVNWGDGSQTVLGGGATVSVSQAVEYNGHRYYVLRQPGLSWFDAQEQAQRLGGNLVTIGDAAENSFVAELLRANFGYYAPAWIGLSDEATEGQFEWASGEASSFTRWFTQDGEPNDYPPQVTEDFAIINYARSFGPGWWNDLSGTRDSANYWGTYAVVEVDPTHPFTVRHQYRDGTATGSFPITVTVADDDGGTATASAAAAVANTAPGGLTVTADAVTVNEDGSVTLTGSFVDRGTLDAHTVTIDWKDGTTTTVTVPAFAAAPSPGVTLAEGAEFQGRDYYLITTPLSWEAAEAEARRLGGHLVTINSAEENLFVFQYIRRAARTGDVQAWIGLSDGGAGGPFAWSSGDALGYTNWAAGEPGNPAGPTGIAFNFNNTQIGARWGDFAAGTPLFAVIEIDGKRTFTATHRYLDDNPSGTPSDAYAIGVTVADDDGGTATTSTGVVVHNVAPVVGSVTGPVAGTPTAATPSGPAVTFTGVRGQPLAFAAAFGDVGTLDTHEVRWDFGDGSETGWVAAGGLAATAPAHAYAAAGTYTVTVSVRDDDGGTASFAWQVTVTAVELQADPNDPTKTTLVVGGTAGADDIEITPGSTPGSIEVFVNGASLGTYSPTGSVTVFAQAGDDDVQVAGSIALPAWLYGGAGNDRLKGGAGHDVLLGGDGDDLIIGGQGRDILIAGTGADRVVGNADDDVLVAGATLYDDDRFALGLLRGVWVDQTRTYEQRVTALRSPNTLPGGVRLDSSTVSRDASADVLTGSAGMDWFVFDPYWDRVTDLGDEAFDPDRDFIGNN